MSLVKTLANILPWPIDVCNIVDQYAASLIESNMCSDSFTSYTYDDTTYYYMIDNIIQKNRNGYYLLMTATFCLCNIQNVDYMLYVVVKSHLIKVIALPEEMHISNIQLGNDIIYQITCYNDLLVIQVKNYIKIYQIYSINDIRYLKSIKKIYSQMTCRLLCMNAKYIFILDSGYVEIYDYGLNLIKSVFTIDCNSSGKCYDLIE